MEVENIISNPTASTFATQVITSLLPAMTIECMRHIDCVDPGDLDELYVSMSADIDEELYSVIKGASSDDSSTEDVSHLNHLRDLHESLDQLHANIVAAAKKELRSEIYSTLYFEMREAIRAELYRELRSDMVQEFDQIKRVLTHWNTSR